MGKVLNRIGRLILLVTMIGSYTMWVVGIDAPVTKYMYANSSILLLIAVILVLLLNCTELKFIDWLTVALALATWLLFHFTESIRHSTMQTDTMIPLIILLVLCFKVCVFDRLDQTLLLIVSLVALSATLYRMSVELPQLIPADEIFKESNKLESIWINTNTIGATLMFSTMMASSLIKAYRNKVFNLLLLPVYIGGVLGTWVSQSKTSFAILVGFILVDNLLPKRFLQRSKVWLFGFVGVAALGPLLFYLCAESDTVDLFTGRERIWHEFFAKWLSDPQHIKVGMEPFVASWKPLGTHNAFLFTLSNFGVIGYLILFGFLVSMILLIGFRKKTLDRLQVSLLLGFLLIWIHSFMEDILLAPHWMPIVYSFLGLAFYFRPEKKRGRHERPTTPKRRKRVKQTSPVSNEERPIAPVDEEGWDQPEELSRVQRHRR